MRGRERAPAVVKMLCVGYVKMFWEKIRMKRCAYDENMSVLI
jgi:hypothetical protein